MPEFNKDDYLNDLPDAGAFGEQPDAGATQGASDQGAGAAKPKPSDKAHEDAESTEARGTASDAAQADSHNRDGAESGVESTAEDADAGKAQDDELTPLGKAKREAADYLEALQRERAEFINYRNRSAKEQERFRQHGIIDVLTGLLPALDDIDRIREHGDLSDSFNAVSAKIDKTFEKFGVEKFGEKGEDFDPVKHEAVLHRPDENATKETVDAVVEAGYRIGDRVIRAARVVVASPQH